MKIYAHDGESVNIRVWAYGDGEFKPLQTENAIDEFDISINGKTVTVFYNKSKSNVDYYYLNFNKLWHWTRDNIRNNSQYIT